MASSMSNIGFLELGFLLENSSKTINFLQVSGLIPDDTKKDCLFCGIENCVVLRKNSKQIIPYTLTL